MRRFQSLEFTPRRAAPGLLGAAWLLLSAGLLTGCSSRPYDGPEAVVQRSEAWDPETVDLAGTIPVQEGGRIKPLDTLAGFRLLKWNGKRKLVTPTGEKLERTEWLLDVLLFPEQARYYRHFLVRDSAAITAIGLKPEREFKKSDRWSYEELLPARDELFSKGDEYSRIDPKERMPLQREILGLASHVSEFEALTTFLEFSRTSYSVNGSAGLQEIFGGAETARFTEVLEQFGALRLLMETIAQQPEPDMAEAEAVEQLALAVEDTLNRNWRGLAIFPTPPDADDSEPWLNPADVVASHVGLGDQAENFSALAGLEAVEDAKGDPAALKQELRAVHETLSGRANLRGEYDKIPMEVDFYRANYFVNALVFYLLGFLLVALSWLGHRRWMTWGIWGSVSAATVLVIVGITLRCILRSRPPVSTLYETILFIAACAVLVALFIEWINRQRIALGIATVLGAFGMFLSLKYELKEAATAGDTMPSLVAVLDTNFWLSTHVTTVTLGYAAGLLAAAIAHVWIIGKLLGLRKGDKVFYKTISRMVYGIICFGLLFSVVGTVLGGIWANYSWGRFWGWDPKENGALLICIWELLILHGRLGGFIRDAGLMAMAVVGGVVVAFSWWGVNLLGVGLHSYGFTSGIQAALFGFYGFEAVVLVLWLVALARGAADRKVTPA